MNHFNKGIIFGKVISAKPDTMKDKIDPTKQTVCANLQISCAGDFGRVNVFAKIWREEAAKRFLAENNKDKYLRLEGFFAQYESRGQIKSNYNIYSWDPLTTKDQNDQRAVFILVGEVIDLRYDEDGEPLVVLQTEREGYTSTFTLHTFGTSMDHLDTGVTCRVKGELRPTEDRFGDTVAVRPLILDWKLMTEDGPAPVPVPEGAQDKMQPEGDIPF